MRYIVVSILALFFTTINSSQFEEVLERTENSTLKKRLIEFEKNGIEKSTNKTDFDIDQLIDVAMSFLETPHKMGGCTKEGIDCSGLVMTSFKEVGVLLPHSAHEQARFGKVIANMEDLEKGDMVFFYNSYTTSNLITHSGIYIGDGKFIHTSNSRGVIIGPVNDPYYWGERYLFGTRIKQ